MANPITKFEVSSQIYFMGCKIRKNEPCDPEMGRFFIGRVGRTMVSLYTKSEVCRCPRYKAMNYGAKCRKWGGLGQLGVTQGHRQCHHLIVCI